MSENRKKNRNRNKDFFWGVVGPYCRRCGYSECVSALQFHHLDPEVKDDRQDTLGTWLGNNRYRLVQKLANTRFTILCANCHIKLHVILREKDVHLNPIDTTVFSEMLKCMYRPKRIINRQRQAVFDSIHDARDETRRLEELDFEDLAIGNCRA